MKKIILTMLVVAFITACSKDDNNNDGNGYPKTYLLYFDLIKSDGIIFEEGEVSYQFGRYDKNGEWIVWSHLGPDTWDVLNKEEHPVSNQVYFNSGGFMSVPYWELPEREYVETKYYLLKYLDSEVIDTVMIRQRALYLEYSYFEFFLNGEFIHSYDVYNDEGNDEWRNWIITLNKEEF